MPNFLFSINLNKINKIQRKVCYSYNIIMFQCNDNLFQYFQNKYAVQQNRIIRFSLQYQAFKHLLMLLFDAIVTLLPIYGYYTQYSLIKSKQSVGSFSIDLCGIVLIANILKIMFWFSKGFALILLAQSVMVIIMQLLLLNLCVNLGYKNNDLSGFWRWNKFSYFITFLLFFTTLLAGMTYFSKIYSMQNYGKMIGTLGLSIEGFIGFPLIIKNQKNRSVQGLSVSMIIIWFLGDLMKTIYFVIEIQPMQFVISGLVQFISDNIIIGQILFFARKNHPKVVISQKITQQSVNFDTQTTDSDLLADEMLIF